MGNGIAHWLRVHVRELSHGFWFVPGLVVAAHAGLAVVVLVVDYGAGPDGVDLAPFDGGATAARTILAAVAGSLMTVAGVTFSITIVSLQLMSSQFTPRALRNFLGDRVNQLTAGVFVGVFLYCILVLRTVRTEAEEFAGFVPSLAVSVAIVLSVVALAFLLVFVHHTTQTIQVSNATRSIARATVDALDTIYPERFDEADLARRDELVGRWRSDGDPYAVCARDAGFIRTIALDELARGLPDGARVHVAYAPGDFVTTRDRVAEVWPAEAGEGCEDAIAAAIVTAGERDLGDDAEYGIRQLADIAIKALSPSVNDPTTAVTAIGYLRAVLEQLAARAMPADVVEESGVTLAVRRRSWAEYVDALSELAPYGAGSRPVVLALASALAEIAGAAAAAGAADRLEAVRAAAGYLREHALGALEVEADRAAVEQALGPGAPV